MRRKQDEGFRTSLSTQPVKDLVERLMGKNPEHRFQFIQNHASALSEDEIDA